MSKKPQTSSQKKSKLIKVALLSLAVLELLNVASFTIGRLLSPPKCKLHVLREAGPDEPTNYLLAGMANQPGNAYNFLIDKLDGGIVLVEYTNYGFDPDAVAQQLREHSAGNYKSVYYTLSLADHVIRRLEQDALENEVFYSLNPCVASYALSEEGHRQADEYDPIAKIVCYAAGWISTAIPLTTDESGNTYSLALLVDQLDVIKYDDPDPSSLRRVSGIVLSSEDIFLDNTAVREYFGDGPTVVEICSKHSDTIVNSHLYDFAYQLIADSE